MSPKPSVSSFTVAHRIDVIGPFNFLSSLASLYSDPRQQPSQQTLQWGQMNRRGHGVRHTVLSFTNFIIVLGVNITVRKRVS